jgi:uncharacterized membrane protein YebE (DUF533 family)
MSVQRIGGIGLAVAAAAVLAAHASGLIDAVRLAVSGATIEGEWTKGRSARAAYRFEIEDKTYEGETDTPEGATPVIVYVESDPSIHALSKGGAYAKLATVLAGLGALAGGVFLATRPLPPAPPAPGPRPVRSFEHPSSSITVDPREVMFRTVVTTIASDGTVTARERAYLEALREKLGLPEDLLGQALESAFRKEASVKIPRDPKVRKELIKYLVEATTADGACSPAERKKVGAVAMAIGFPLDEMERLFEEAGRRGPQAPHS